MNKKFNPSLNLDHFVQKVEGVFNSEGETLPRDQVSEGGVLPPQPDALSPCGG